MDKGIHLNIPEDEYHKIKAIGSSPLKRFHDCPATCFDSIEQSESMLLGLAQDCYSLMGEDYFLSRFVVKPDFGDQRKSENKQKSEEFEKSIKDKLILPTYVTTA